MKNIFKRVVVKNEEKCEEMAVTDFDVEIKLSSLKN